MTSSKSLKLYYWTGKLVVTTICSFELLGIWGPKFKGRRSPTITAIVHGHRDRPIGKAIVATLLGWELYHLLVEKPQTIIAIQLAPESNHQG